MKKSNGIAERTERALSIQKAAMEARAAAGIKRPIESMIGSSEKEIEKYCADNNEQSDKNLVTVSFEIDRDIYDQCVELFTGLGTTIEEMALAFIEFCVQNPHVIKAYLKEDTDMKLKQMVFDSVYAIASKTKGPSKRSEE